MLRNAFHRFRNAQRMHPVVARISYTVANQRCRLTARLFRGRGVSSKRRAENGNS